MKTRKQNQSPTAAKRGSGNRENSESANRMPQGALGGPPTQEESEADLESSPTRSIRGARKPNVRFPGPLKTAHICSGWLPQVNPHLAPRLNALLKPDSLAADGDSAELLVLAAMEDAYRGRATDMHFDPFNSGWRIRFRTDGYLHEAAQVNAALGQRMVRLLRTLGGLDPVLSHPPQDASFQFELQDGQLDIRLAAISCQGGEKLALRLLDPRRVQRRIRDLGLCEEHLRVLGRWLNEAAGVCLVTGPTGSGKTTTLYALIHELELPRNAVITIEDPVEYPIDGLTQIQVDTTRGLTFAAGLRAMLRLDPDYLVVGEMRDSGSAQTAVEAAASGHFVMSTLHSVDAAAVITLLRNWALPDHQVATALRIVVNQRLVRRLCPKCRRPAAPTNAERAWLKSFRLTPPAKVWRAAGCAACQQTGYNGRIGVFEIWQKSDSDYGLILNHTDEQSLRRNLRRRGIKTVLQDGLAKAQQGITSLSELQHMGVKHG